MDRSDGQALGCGRREDKLTLTKYVDQWTTHHPDVHPFSTCFSATVRVHVQTSTNEDSEVVNL